MLSTGISRFKSFPAELWLFAAVFFVTALRLAGLFQNAPLPGWDTPSHFFTLTKMADYLQHGSLTGYLHEWLGGMPLFDLYAPLLFVALAGVWLLTFKLVPLLLLFRIGIFLVLLSVPVSLWVFLRAFCGRQVARWGIVLSLLYLFYPLFYSLFGIGAGAAIWAGLIASTLALSFVLLNFASLELLRRTGDRRYWYFVALLSAGLLLTHTLQSIAFGITFAAYALTHVRDGKFVVRAGTALLAGAGLAAFWLLPFVAHLEYSAGASVGAGELAVHPFFLLFPFRVPYLSAAAAAVLALAVAGAFLQLKRRQFALPAMLAALLLVISFRSALAAAVPDLTLHYLRLLPMAYALVLGCAAVAVSWIWERWTGGTPLRRWSVALAVGALVLNAVTMFDFQTVPGASGAAERKPLAWQDETYPFHEEAESLVRLLGERQDAGRVLVQVPAAEGLVYFGSLHRFTSQLPQQYGQAVITGLYVESAPLAPFIMPTLDALTRGRIQVYGDARLRLVRPFLAQDFRLHLERLKMFGVNYLAAFSPEVSEALRQSGQAELVGKTEHFSLYGIAGAWPRVFRMPVKPALFVDADGRVPFRELALAVYAHPQAFPVQVADGGTDAGTVRESTLSDFSALVVSGSGLEPERLRQLLEFGHPVIVLNPNPELAAAVPEGGLLTYIERFETIPKNRTAAYEVWPAGWQELGESLLAAVVRYPAAEGGRIAVPAWGAERIASEDSPATVATGYWPYWQAVDCADCTVYRVSPDFIYVTGQGQFALVYRPDFPKRAGQWLSLLTALALLAPWVYRRVAKLRHIHH